MTPRRVRTREELVQVLRDRKEALDISCLTLDSISGIADGLSGKVLSPQPLKNIGPVTLAALLEALALGIAEIVVIEDVEQASRVRERWVPRKRAPTKRPRRVRC